MGTYFEKKNFKKAKSSKLHLFNQFKDFKGTWKEYIFLEKN